MNVIISNKKQSELSNLDIDVIKSLNGEYEANELVDMFKSFFYNKMILDVTAIKNYSELDTYEILSKGLGTDKIIFLLPEGSKLCTPNFLSHLIDLGIYNFTTNLNGIKYLLKKPNTLKEVEHIQKMVNGGSEEKEVVKEEKSNEEVVKVNNNVKEDIVKTTAKVNDGLTVIGFKNITEDAGATTLIYMLRKELAHTYGNDNVIGIEINKNDFSYFGDKHLFSVKENEIKSAINSHSQARIILIDLNNSVDDSFCGDVVNLIEPSTIKLNKLIQKNKMIFTNLANKKVILNKSSLLNNDVSDFEKEAGIRVFYNMPSLDERKRNEVISDFLTRLGLLSNNSNNNSGGIFGLFRR